MGTDSLRLCARSCAVERAARGSRPSSRRPSPQPSYVFFHHILLPLLHLSLRMNPYTASTSSILLPFFFSSARTRASVACTIPPSSTKLYIDLRVQSASPAFCSLPRVACIPPTFLTSFIYFVDFLYPRTLFIGRVISLYPPSYFRRLGELTSGLLYVDRHTDS